MLPLLAVAGILLTGIIGTARAADGTAPPLAAASAAAPTRARAHGQPRTGAASPQTTGPSTVDAPGTKAHGTATTTPAHNPQAATHPQHLAHSAAHSSATDAALAAAHAKAAAAARARAVAASAEAKAPAVPSRVVEPTQAASLFGVQSWFIPPPPPPPPPPLPPPAPSAPPFPYSFMGSFAPVGEATVFFLARGDRITDAHVGERLDGVYDFESADGGQLVFNYVPLNIRQTISTGAPR